MKASSPRPVASFMDIAAPAVDIAHQGGGPSRASVGRGGHMDCRLFQYEAGDVDHVECPVDIGHADPAKIEEFSVPQQRAPSIVAAGDEEAGVIAAWRARRGDRPADVIEPPGIGRQPRRPIGAPEGAVEPGAGRLSAGRAAEQQAGLLEGLAQGRQGERQGRRAPAAAPQLLLDLGTQGHVRRRLSVAAVKASAGKDIDVGQECGARPASAHQNFGRAPSPA